MILNKLRCSNDKWMCLLVYISTIVYIYSRELTLILCIEMFLEKNRKQKLDDSTFSESSQLVIDCLFEFITLWRKLLLHDHIMWNPFRSKLKKLQPLRFARLWSKWSQMGRELCNRTRLIFPDRISGRSQGHDQNCYLIIIRIEWDMTI